MFSPNHVQMKVVDGLASILAIIDDNPVSIPKALLLSNLLRGEHELPQNANVAFFGIGNARQPIPFLWNHKHMRRRDRVDVAKCQHIFRLQDHSRRDLLVDDLIEYRRLSIVHRSSSRRLLTRHAPRCVWQVARSLSQVRWALRDAVL